MAKQSSQVRNQIQGEGRRVNSEHDQFMNLITGRLNNPDAFRGYDSIINRGPSSYDSSLREMGRTGGLTDENRSRIRGSGVFDEYSRTGGFSDADKSNIRARSNRTIPAFYDAMRDKFKESAQISGSAGPSYSASMRRTATDQSRRASEQASDTEFDLMDAVNKGRQWGAEGVSGAETGLANVESANRRFGLGTGAHNELAGQGLTLDALRGRGNEEFGLYNMILNSIGQRGQLSGANTGQRANYDPNVSWFDRLMRIWGQANQSASALGGTNGLLT